MPIITDEAIIFEWDRDRWRRAPAQFDRIVNQRLGQLGEYIVRWMRERGPQDTGIALESLRAEVTPFGEGAYVLTVFSLDPKAPWALEFGRDAGRAAPPLEKMVGWVNRKGFSDDQISKVRVVGRRIGSSYASRKSPKLVDRRIELVTKQFSFTTSATVRAAFLVMRKIATEGVRAPRLFTRAVTETLVAQEVAKLRIARDMADAINSGVY